MQGECLQRQTFLVQFFMIHIERVIIPQRVMPTWYGLRPLQAAEPEALDDSQGIVTLPYNPALY